MLFTLISWTKSPALFQYDPAREVSSDTGLIPSIPVDRSAIESVSVKVRSHDGVRVPLVILRQRGVPRNGGSPTLLWGYGAYGFEMTSPHFLGAFLAWLERGGSLAVAGVRGGGEYGEAWHLAGKPATKSNTWEDFIACGEYLVREKYTSPEHLSGMGESEGGILIGNAITERPDLFRAAVILVGINNPLRMETTASGVPNRAEFGTHKTEAGFRALLAMDLYHKVRDGVKYPAVLLMHGINDPRVEPWMSAKMAARLQAATSSGFPVLLRIDYDAGHGFGSTRKQQTEERADTFAFLFHELAGERR
jgi:prolyl oligopeptidase